MTVQFVRGLTNFSLVVAPKPLERTEPVILPDKSLWRIKQRRNIGLAGFEEEKEYSARQSRARRRAWNRKGQ